MPSARQIAKVLARRGVNREHAQIIRDLDRALVDHQTEADAVTSILAVLSHEQLVLARDVIGDVLAAMETIETTYVPSRVLTAGDLKTYATQEAIAGEQ